MEVEADTAEAAKLPRWAKFAGVTVTVGVCAFAAWIVISWALFLRGTSEDTTALRRSSGPWHDHLNIPTEATLVRSEKFRRMVEDGERFEFTLPESRTPEVWMAQMVKGRPLEQYKFTPLRYDAGEGPAAELNKPRIQDDFELTYDAGSKIYRFQVAYD